VRERIGAGRDPVHVVVGPGHRFAARIGQRQQVGVRVVGKRGRVPERIDEARHSSLGQRNAYCCNLRRSDLVRLESWLEFRCLKSGVMRRFLIDRVVFTNYFVKFRVNQNDESVLIRDPQRGP
jgi:hypothetical protein